jgi:hypothetical protein
MRTDEVETPHGLARAHVQAADKASAAPALGHGAAGGAQVRRAAPRLPQVANDRDRQLPHADERILLRVLLHGPRGLLSRRCVFAGDADHLGSNSAWKYFKFTS